MSMVLLMLTELEGVFVEYFVKHIASDIVRAGLLALLHYLAGYTFSTEFSYSYRTTNSISALLIPYGTCKFSYLTRRQNFTDKKKLTK